MRLSRVFFIFVLAVVLGPADPALFAVSVHGAAGRTGYNAGSAVIIRAVLEDAAGAGQYGVFAAVRYAGSKSGARVLLRRQGGNANRFVYQGAWPIPQNVSTGLYNVVLSVEDSTRRVVASNSAPGFFVYKKQVEITRLSLDKDIYAPGERIRCEVGIKNLSNHPLDGLRVEFSNENYPWISAFSGNENGAGRMTVNPSLGLVVLRKSLDIPARGQATLPMEAAGVATFLEGSQVAMMGAGGPARHDKVPPPEIDRYTIAVWDAGRKNLLDMQFSPDVIVREPGRVLPKPYSRNYTHPYNDEIDFTKYREFYPPGYISTAISVDRSRTLYRPGDEVAIRASVRNMQGQPIPRELTLTITSDAGSRIFSSPYPVNSRGQGEVAMMRWKSPEDLTPGVYTIEINTAEAPAIPPARSEIAFNKLPSSLMVFCPHEDDEHPWAGLMRAMIEAGLPVHVVFYTGGDVGECERYYGGHPCDPVRAREFGTVRMEESVEALRHIGVRRDLISFLGLPDGGSGEIWFHHIHAVDPFLDIYMAVDHAPYEHGYEQNLPYARDSVIAAVKQLLVTYHPSMIAVPHPDERHVDHRTANWFTIKACQELLHEGKLDQHTVVLADRAYGSGGYKPAPYHYANYIFYLSGEAAILKQEMGWIYQSQDGNLDEGAKRTFEELPRQAPHYRILDWQQHAGWNE